ncbi:MAG TPA: DNA topoisomerase IB [Burkholderiaceae bacterium]|nr:DNA topoisomerase IB [Burkholderiaceae bacterium]
MPSSTTTIPPERALAAYAGLHYVSDAMPGIARKWARDKPYYVDAQGKRVRDAATLERIRKLAIPPAYVDVWICPDPNGHLQATGRDARGRKQYRYHERWREIRDADKYGQMLEFGHALPRIRMRIKRDIAKPGLPRDRVIAAVVRLLDLTRIRIGNEEYARENRSYGLTTLRTRHVRERGREIVLEFRGKSGVHHRASVGDPVLNRVIRRCLELPGQELFRYVDEQGEPRTVTSTDVNDYLREITGGDFTAKDFRTWAGSVRAFAALRDRREESVTALKKHIVDVVRLVAAELGNTPAVCRKSYVHPAVFEAHLSQTLPGSGSAVRRRIAALDHEEADFLAFLKRTQRVVRRTLAPSRGTSIAA